MSSHGREATSVLPRRERYRRVSDFFIVIATGSADAETDRHTGALCKAI